MRARVLGFAWVLAVVGTPQVALAQLDSAVRECASDGSPTFFPRQGRWPAVPDFDNSQPLPVVVLYDSALAGFSGGSDQEAVIAALNQYNLQTCGASQTSFPNIFLGAPGAFNFADQTVAGIQEMNLNRRGDEVDDEGSLLDYYNVIRWVSSAETSTFPGGAQTLAVTSSVVLQTTEIAVTSDIEFNAIDFQWRSETEGCPADGTNGCQDIYTVAIHEIGHFVGFGHVECADATMYRFHQGNTVS
ncbi:MAG: matrixin family metalloprotease, partial [Myxococcota bacterium]